ncbi:hypothetical protein BDZ89DRAFT_1170156 [Hymenopellis radicata]|nr:hypothetical protein BDZ89DRAFT_1170156 [Hymenopellis radicata]
MSDTTTTAGYLRRTGEWILMGALPLIVKSMAWTAVLACWISLLIVHAKKKRTMRRGSSVVIIFSAMFALAVGDEGKITPAEKASILDAEENGFVTIAGNGLGLVMILLGDSLVLWRAWELSSCDVTAKRILVCSGALLLSYMGTIPVVLICQSQRVVNNREPFFAGTSGQKIAVNWCLSLISNLLSTCVIAYIGWSHRTEMRELFSFTKRRTSPAEKILGLLAESGFLYFSVNIIFIITVRFTPETYSARSVIADIFLTITPCVGVFVPMTTHIIVLLYGSFWDTMEYSGLSASSDVLDSTSMHGAAGSRTSLETSFRLLEREPEDIREVSKKHLNLDSK